jgi:hypothetical protein
MNEKEMSLIEMLCKPLAELLKKHPYHSITIDAEHIEVNSTVMRMPLINERLRKAFGLTGKEGDEG